MEVVRHGRVDLTPLLTHIRFGRYRKAYDLFGERLDGVMKVAIRPNGLSKKMKILIAYDGSEWAGGRWKT